MATRVKLEYGTGFGINYNVRKGSAAQDLQEATTAWQREVAALEEFKRETARQLELDRQRARQAGASFLSEYSLGNLLRDVMSGADRHAARETKVDKEKGNGTIFENSAQAAKETALRYYYDSDRPNNDFFKGESFQAFWKPSNPSRRITYGQPELHWKLDRTPYRRPAATKDMASVNQILEDVTGKEATHEKNDNGSVLSRTRQKIGIIAAAMMSFGKAS